MDSPGSFPSAGSFILPTELDWEEPGSWVWAVCPQASLLGGPVADARSWLASGCNLVATEETLILGGSVSPQTDTCLARLALAGIISGREAREMDGWLTADSEREERIFRAEMRYLRAPVYKQTSAGLVDTIAGKHDSSVRVA